MYKETIKIDLFNSTIEIKLKKIRLIKVTAEAVIHDTDAFNTINGFTNLKKVSYQS